MVSILSKNYEDGVLEMVFVLTLRSLCLWVATENVQVKTHVVLSSHLRPDAGEPLRAVLGVALLPRRRPHIGALPRRNLDRQSG